MHDSTRLRQAVTLAAIGTILVAAAAGATGYEGDRVDIYTGETRGKWIVTTKPYTCADQTQGSSPDAAPEDGQRGWVIAPSADDETSAAYLASTPFV